ncbi:MAG: hypothetical protein J6X02_00975 [Bacilli bacterium]|nr:hypothetical protein [Bacilli bacterium]
MKVNNITISFWFKEFDSMPQEKVEELENSLKSILDVNFLYNDMPIRKNIDIPRIQAKSSDNKNFFTLSLINCNLSIDVGDTPKDDIILLVNEHIQLLYDVLKEVYDVKIVYTSIKINAVDKKNSKMLLDKLSLSNDYEDISLKRVKRVDDCYYECLILTSTKEVNYNIQVMGDEKPLESDLYNRSMLISSSEANIGKEYLDIFYEINDRLSYNLDKDYLTTKENIRGLVIEMQNFLNKDIDDLV